jgi:hypothetical protein
MDKLTRRTFLRGAAGLGAATVLVSLEPQRASAVSRPHSMAMHIHASFSEGSGTMLAHLQQAAATGVDVIWWTEHDWRMAGLGYWDAIHFAGDTESAGPLTLEWRDGSSGSFRSRSATFVSEPVSPTDPDTRALRLAATGASTSSFAVQRRWADTPNSRLTLRGSLSGVRVSIDLLPESIGHDAFLELRFLVGYRPATAGRPAGMYSVAYRLGGPDPVGTRRAVDLAGIVVLPATAGRWNEITVSPTADIAELWPDLLEDDAGMCELSVAVGSRNGKLARGVFDNLRIRRDLDPVGVQRELMDRYAAAFRRVKQRRGLEVSLFDKHLNWYGGDIRIPDYTGVPVLPVIDDPTATRALVSTIQQAGGVSGYNHIFGTGSGTDPQGTQESRRRMEAATLVRERLYGADLLEVAYRRYGGVTMDRHLAVWDTCSRNLIFATGVGSSDDHGGSSWLSQENNFVTCAWAQDAAESSLLDALLAGRCFFADLRRFGNGSLDLSVDGTYGMGSVAVGPAIERELRVRVSEMPEGGSLRIVSGPVDAVGPATPDPGTTVRSIPSAALAGGKATVAIDTSSPRFVRVEVWDGSNRLVAGSNPVWLLREEPPGGIPPARSVTAGVGSTLASRP